MDRDDPDCPIRRQVVPSIQERENTYGVPNYLIWKENRDTSEVRPDCIARQYVDRVAFTVSDACAIYCRHCFRKELVVDRDLQLRFDVEEGLTWIREHPEVRDVLITGGSLPVFRRETGLPDPQATRNAALADDPLRNADPIVLPQRVTEGLKKVLAGRHRVPIWINTQCNHPNEITEQTAQAVYDLLTCR